MHEMAPEHKHEGWFRWQQRHKKANTKVGFGVRLGLKKNQKIANTKVRCDLGGRFGFVVRVSLLPSGM